MLLAINKIYQIESFFKNLVEDNTIIDFKIVLLLNMRIEVHLLVENRISEVKLFEHTKLKDLDRLISFYQIELEEEEDKEWFEGEKIDFELRRRLNNFINIPEKTIEAPCPVFTFYSYKGGVGRTTTLAFFASWLATHHAKKVVIIDCDFEAPGFNNYYNLNIEGRKGIVEYLLDKEYSSFTGDDLDIKKDYTYQVEQKYVGKGDIFIVPAGNLSNEEIEETGRTHREDYLEALARIDINGIRHITKQFQDFFQDLKQQLGLTYENSVILIDSRTGFNDIFAVLASLSDTIVGFFGINKQSQIGLGEFLDMFGQVDEKEKDIILVNAIAGSERIKPFEDFVKDYIDNDKFLDEELGPKMFANSIFRTEPNNDLAVLGSSLEVDENFLRLVERPPLSFEDLFKKLSENIQNKIESYQNRNTTNIYEEYKPLQENIEESENIETLLENSKNKVDKIALREDLLREISKEGNFPELYADFKKPNIDEFYFRDCLKDVFNRDKFLIVGYKGTGKTYIYHSFENSQITQRLCERENLDADKYIFVNVIPIVPQSEEGERYFETSKFPENKITELGNSYFFENFWLSYIWSSVFNNSVIKELLHKNNLALSYEHRSIMNDKATVNWLVEIIEDTNITEKFEKDLKNLDTLLKKENKTLILSFDQLDSVVKPHKWKQGVSPLIDYWRNNLFSRIYPKIFVRADLYNQIQGVNTQSIDSQKKISLEWEKEEFYAYFFKFVFRVVKQKFFQLIYAYNNYAPQIKEKLLKINEQIDEDNQIPKSDTENLRLLVANFFGEHAYRYDSSNSSYGLSYDWFFNNLSDAKKNISIRPFLDLLKSSIEFALKEKSLDNEKQIRNNNQVLSAYYYASSESKKYSVERYYNDLAQEEGNGFLDVFKRYLQNDGLDKYRIYEFRREEMDAMLSDILKKGKDIYKSEESIKDKSIDDLKNILVNNGIVEIKHISQNKHTRYIIPFLYRSFFNLRNPNPKKSRLQ